jgi:putative ABC transport system permease protein
MWQHNFLLFFRNIKRNKTSFIINLIGLSTGLACALLIYLWVDDELNFDKFHEKDNQLFQVMQNIKTTKEIVTLGATPGPLAETLAEEMPDVEYAVSVFEIHLQGKPNLSFKDKKIKANCIFAGKDFFNIFSYNLIEGNANQVLADKNSIVISEDLAKILFNSTANFTGKTINYQNEKQFLVSGIFKNVPPNSSMQFDFVLSDKVLRNKYPSIDNWGNNHPSTYILLKQNTNIRQFNDKIARLIERKCGESNRTLFLKPYSDNYLYGNYINGKQTGGRIEYVKLFSIIAVFILVIACINFMNLSTARASGKMKEIGIKKALGASRKSLIFQYLTESILMAFLSLFIAIVIIELFLPLFNEITGKHIIVNFFSSHIYIFLGITLITGLISGSYPALYLSLYNPAKVLKGKLHDSISELWTRKGLVVFQFALSGILIVSVLIVYKQIEYIQNKNLGFNKENVLYFDMEGRVAENQEAFLSEVKNIPGIVNASSTMYHIIGKHNTTGGVTWEGKNPDDIIDFHIYRINYDFIETHGIEMKEGRAFSKDFGSDDSKIICNEAAIKTMGIENPIGKIINLNGENRQIIGVTKDFHFESLHKMVNPLFFILESPSRIFKMMVKINSGTGKETIDKLRILYENFNPGFVFEYKFLDEDYQAIYVAEKRIGVLSRYFAGLAILISCLGLLGLASFAAERRQKEIGIRKTNGAKTREIMLMLSKDFTKWIGIAFIIACPIAYYFMNKWLQNFAYRTNINWWIFGIAVAIALTVALLTVSLQSWRAASRNPVEALRYE